MQAKIISFDWSQELQANLSQVAKKKEVIAAWIAQYCHRDVNFLLCCLAVRLAILANEV